MRVFALSLFKGKESRNEKQEINVPYGQISKGTFERKEKNI
jgi:hypothetical protein